MNLLQRVTTALSASVLVVSLTMTLSSCSTLRQAGSGFFATADFFRVETFPARDEIAIGGLTGKGIEHTYKAPFSRVWPAVRRAAARMDKLSRKSVQGMQLSYRGIIAVNDRAGALKIGKIVDPGEVGDLTGIGIRSNGNSWDDEFLIKADTLSPTQTKVLVIRRVVESVKADQYALRFKLEEKASSGNYERWLLTQIEDDLAGKLKD